MNKIFESIDKELKRQQEHFEMIASENIVSKNVLKAQGSILTNKYSEGECKRRYYGGCEYIDEIEQETIDLCKKLFKCNFANVQPHSGANANLAAYFAVCEYFKCKPQDLTIIGMSLDNGGHLTHGAKPTISGKWFKSIQYGTDLNGIIDYEKIKELVQTIQGPKVLVVGGSAYSRIINFEMIRNFIIDDTIMMVDMAHFAGLVAGNVYPNPINYADIVTSTTHKTLRGPRGGIILTNREDLSKLINKAIFPGCQGGPLEHVIAAKGVCFHEALQPEFNLYASQVIKNCKVLADELSTDLKIVSSGTDTHLILLDVSPYNIDGIEAESMLARVNIVCNKNSIPGDTNPVKPSGIRLGTPAGTSRGAIEEDFKIIAKVIKDVLFTYSQFKINITTQDVLDEIIHENKEIISNICKKYPIYKEEKRKEFYDSDFEDERN